MKLTIDNALAVIRVMIESHFQECEDKYKYLADTDHETIEDFMEEMKDTFIAEFEEE